LGSKLSDAWRELQKYPGSEIRVADAVSIVARVIGIRVHLLRDDEISEALDYARQLIMSEKVLHGPYSVKNEIVKASREAWSDLSPPARSLIGSVWADKAGVDLVVTTLDPIQTKGKILHMIANLLEQNRRYPLGRAVQRQDESVNQTNSNCASKRKPGRGISDHQGSPSTR